MRPSSLNQSHWLTLASIVSGDPTSRSLDIFATGLSSDIDGPMGVSFEEHGQLVVVGPLPPVLCGGGDEERPADHPFTRALAGEVVVTTAADEFGPDGRGGRSGAGSGPGGRRAGHRSWRGPAGPDGPVAARPDDGRPARHLPAPPPPPDRGARPPAPGRPAAAGAPGAARSAHRPPQPDPVLRRARTGHAGPGAGRPLLRRPRRLQGGQRRTRPRARGCGARSIGRARLAGAARAGDLVARLGGDEFAVFCPAVHDAADRRRHRPHASSTRSPPTTPAWARRSGWRCCSPVPWTDDAVLAADGALYEAKRAGRGTWRLAEVG